MNKVLYILIIPLILFPLNSCEEEVGNDTEVKELQGKIREVSNKKYGAQSGANVENSDSIKAAPSDALEPSDPEPSEPMPSEPEPSEALFEGDIDIDVDQAGKKTDKEKLFRTNKKWKTLKIPYVFNYTGTTEHHTDPKWQESIRKGLKHIEEQTCIRFYDAGDAKSVAGQDHIIFYSGKGCLSPVGSFGHGRGQWLSIGAGCDWEIFTIHETMHALGIWHEQSRDDRDKYVKIVKDNIAKKLTSNFNIHSNGDKMGLPYDLGSIMHYHSAEFSKTKPVTITIETKDKLYQQTIGQRIGMSFKDTKVINLQYCTKICAGKKLKCKNGGYTDPNNCSQCRCPFGLGGILCTDVATSDDENCTGGDLTAKESPEDLSAENLAGGKKCYWRIKPESSDQRVEITFKRLKLPTETYKGKKVRKPCKTFLEIKSKQDKQATGPHLCTESEVLESKIVADVGTDVLVIYSVQQSHDKRKTSFTISYKSTTESTTESTIEDTSTVSSE